MKNKMVALLSGVLFGAGLTISGMVLPAKVVGFLDVAGDWDMSLAFVMGGALLIFMPGYFYLVKPRSRSVSGGEFMLPSYQKIDLRLITGASVFGVGWGLAGICPGPAIVNLVTGQTGIWMFFAAMMVGLGGTSFVLCKLQTDKTAKQTA
ncbi:hypothetical protein VA7868_03242 [Vibrio aerogenes CECT 7868]|uniref:Transporter component n=1 Tax=Vibrio aerogenes CECT 7868 TaxID=1216006 RepID=A0A1M5ZUJ9_9VIBR|nr:YeeE/YedE family protein [Vibrio aerogenes]SHI27828.1 hypothetical protein VA7868_03242 [Vibrio aerogenes CECT 7868]